MLAQKPVAVAQSACIVCAMQACLVLPTRLASAPAAAHSAQQQPQGNAAAVGKPAAAVIPQQRAATFMAAAAESDAQHDEQGGSVCLACILLRTSGRIMRQHTTCKCSMCKNSHSQIVVSPHAPSLRISSSSSSSTRQSSSRHHTIHTHRTNSTQHMSDPGHAGITGHRHGHTPQPQDTTYTHITAGPCPSSSCT